MTIPSARTVKVAALWLILFLMLATPPYAPTQAKPGSPGQTSELEQTLTAMDIAAAKFSSAQAHFTSELYEAVVKERTTQSGTMYIRKTGKDIRMAADFNKPADQRKYVLFAEGKVQLYQPIPNLLTNYDAGKNQEAFQSFLVLGFGSRGHDLEKQFDVKYAGSETVQGTKTVKLELSPKSERVRNMFNRIVLWIDPARGISIQQQFFEISGDYRLVTYSNVLMNQKFPHDPFKLPIHGKPTIVNNG